MGPAKACRCRRREPCHTPPSTQWGPNSLADLVALDAVIEDLGTVDEVTMSTNVEKIVAAREEEEATSKSDERRGARRGSGLRRCAPTDRRQSYGGTTHLKWRIFVTASAESGSQPQDVRRRSPPMRREDRCRQRGRGRGRGSDEWRGVRRGSGARR